MYILTRNTYTLSIHTLTLIPANGNNSSNRSKRKRSSSRNNSTTGTGSKGRDKGKDKGMDCTNNTSVPSTIAAIRAT